ncbi:MAG: hypothetical protein A2447_03965 [Omnitrophica WOR_2 bacterium RIFOXYC2_FULL_38_12]|nr:MAG: hypothetical protein A2447_03965 [Omnitrophica WOR_2 bacterium RIFOXYC2_FULL_38_12]
MIRIFLVILMLFFISCSKGSNSQETKTLSSPSNYLLQYTLPDKLFFCGERVPLEIEEVRERAEREFYLNLQSPGQIIIYLKRAGRFFPMFEKKLMENNVPDDLKFLSVAESALYMPRSSKDAVGLWQFIPKTGKNMGLQIDEYVDERRHPEKSTQAAIEYLIMGYKSSKSWMLAAAGYNMGHENLSDNLKFQNSDNFFDLFLNEETSRYILRIVIVKEIMQNPQKYGFELGPNQQYKPFKYKIVSESGAITNLNDWAKKHKTTYKEVKLLNPWILQRSLPAPPKGKFWEIAIPK